MVTGTAIPHGCSSPCQLDRVAFLALKEGAAAAAVGAACLHPSPPQKSNPRPHFREGQGVPVMLWKPSWSFMETG